MWRRNTRDGNVKPGHGQLEPSAEYWRIFLPGSEEVVPFGQCRLPDALRYLAEGQDARFRVIEFAISCPVYRDFREAVECSL